MSSKIDILSQLTTVQQKALTLYYLSGMSVRTLADILDKPPKTVYDLLERARQKARTVSGVIIVKGPPKPRPSTLRVGDFEKRRRAQQEASDRLYGEA